MKKFLLLLTLLVTIICNGQSKTELYQVRGKLLSNIAVESLRYENMTTDDDSSILRTLTRMQMLLEAAEAVNSKLMERCGKRTRGAEYKENSAIELLILGSILQNELMIAYVKEVIKGMEDVNDNDEATKL